jgi:ribonuclease HI
MTAMKEAISAVTRKGIPDRPVRIVTDSRSTLDRLRTTSALGKPSTAAENDILGKLAHLRERNIALQIVWCPSHCDTEGIEEADTCAAEDTSMEQTSGWTYETAKAVLKRTIKDEKLKHPRLQKIYQDDDGNTKLRKDQDMSRTDQVDIARLRSGHHPELLYWQKKIERTEDATTCRLCGLSEETAEHVLTSCPGVQQMYCPGWTIRDSLDEPERALSIWRAWLQRRDEETPATN